MTLTYTPCVNADLRPKKRYVSERAARRDLAHSQKWLRRHEWPIAYLCCECHGWHLTRGAL